MSEIADNSIDAVVTDPPWNLRFMQKKWDYQLPSTEIWREVMRVLKPGGHALICCGTRTQHRMVVNVEDAGFEVRDICLHIFGSGFPKSHNISVAIDKLYGAERVVIGPSPSARPNHGNNPNLVAINQLSGECVLTAPSTPDAIKWAGWGSALKPAVELWTLVRKPLSEPSIAANILKWGTGGLNIDASRIGNEVRTNAGMSSLGVMHDDDWVPKKVESTVQGRFPANLILGCACESEVHEPDCPVGLLDRQSGVPSGASRFFYCAKASTGERNHGLEGMPSKHVGIYAQDEWSRNNLGNTPGNKREPVQNHHPTVKPIKLLEYLIRMITPPGGRVLDPFAGSGSTLVAAKRLGFEFIGIEIDAEYVAIAEKRVAAVCL